MKIAFFRKNISCEIGDCVAGYGPHDVSIAKLDDLFATGLCVDDGEKKILLISFDLLGLDEWYIRELRKSCAEILGVPESAVLLTCTHTHSGPETRTQAACPEALNRPYLEKLRGIMENAVRELGDYRECIAGYYSALCDANDNRRVVTADNHASFLPHCREMRPLATGFADKELGVVLFMDKTTRMPIYIIGNYAAHPLAGHAPGLGGIRISADFPGAFREYIRTEAGVESMYVSGAAGDMIPKEDELGKDAIKRNGEKLAKETLGAVVDITRNLDRFRLDEKVGSKIGTFTVPMRKFYLQTPKRLPPPYRNREEVTFEVQCVAIGDICFTGVPGELCASLGQEIKWHSPFRRTFIAYDATAYFSYICPGNYLVAGGYEANSQRFSSRGGLLLLNAAVDALYDLREELYPSPEELGEKYPDYVRSPLVAVNLEK